MNIRVDGKLKPRSGRLKITIDREERIIFRLVRINLKQIYADLILRSGVNYSRKTVYRILSHAEITNWIAKKRPLLRQQDVNVRLK